MIDIDDFKEVNDSQGHARGDAVLSQVGKLMTFLRSQDSAYRVGGDEFALILPDTTLDEAHTAIERLRASVAEAMEGVTISAGLGSNLNGITATMLRDHADMALYEAKHRGKNQVAIFSDDLDTGNAVTAGKMKALRELLQSQNIAMWFQPIYRIATKELLAFEALLRMPATPEIEGPEEAFEIAQRMGRSHDLDLLCTAGALDSADELTPEMKLFINLDPATLIHTDFSADELLAMVEERNIDPSKVVFEITEKTAAPLPRLAKQVEALHERGFGVALDDVGAGNSGLEMLRLIKFDYVKIDRSVVLDAMNGGPGRAVILAIVAFARETGAFMIAEGIEDRGMLESIRLDEDGLHKFWVQGVQGFLFGEPRPSVEEYTHHHKPGSAAA
jgi:diguanylate cyclase (GGDEF)-like protein